MSRPASRPLDTAFFVLFVAAAILVPVLYARETAFVAYYPKLLAFQLLTAALCIVWALRGARPWRRTPAVLPAALLLAITVLSVLFSVNRIESLLTIGRQVTMVVFFLAALHNAEVRPLREWLMPVVLACAALSATGILQYGGWAFLWIPTSGMPSATFGYRNYGAMCAVLCAPLSAALLLTARRRSAVAAWTACLWLIAAYLFATRTRSGWIGLAAGVLAAAALVWRGRRRGRDGARVAPVPRRRLAWAALALGLGLAFNLVVPSVDATTAVVAQSPEKRTPGSTVSSLFQERADKGRLILWKNTLAMIGAHPFGVGAGNWRFVYPAYDRGEMVGVGSSPRRPHNDYLWAAAELGIAGLAVWFWLLGLSLRQGARLALAPLSEEARWVALGLLAGLVASLVDAAFSYPSERVEPSFLVWFLLAIFAFTAWRDRGSPGSASPRAALVPLTAAVALVLAGISTFRAIRFDAAFARAAAAAGRADWSRAVDESTLALSTGVYDPEAFLVRGLARLALGDLRGAAEDNLACLSLHPWFVNALNNLAIACSGLGEHGKALAQADRILSINPRHIEVHANRGIALRGLGRFDEAIAAFDQALAREPDRGAFVYERAVTLMAAGRAGEAEAAFEGLLHRDDGNPAVHYRLGILRLRRRRFPEGIAALQRALALDPGYLPAALALGEGFESAGDTARAIHAYEQFLSRPQPGPEMAERVRARIRSLNASR